LKCAEKIAGIIQNLKLEKYDNIMRVTWIKFRQQWALTFKETTTKQNIFAEPDVLLNGIVLNILFANDFVDM